MTKKVTIETTTTAEDFFVLSLCLARLTALQNTRWNSDQIDNEFFELLDVAHRSIGSHFTYTDRYELLKSKSLIPRQICWRWFCKYLGQKRSSIVRSSSFKVGQKGLLSGMLLKVQRVSVVNKRGDTVLCYLRMQSASKKSGETEIIWIFHQPKIRTKVSA